MKHKTFIAVALLALGVTNVAVSQPTLATITCPAGSYREINHIPADNIAQCNLPANEIATDGSEKDALWYISAVINVILSLVGVVAVVVLILGGISFMTSQGDPGKVTKARNTILYGVIGIIVALLAFTIVNFVLKNIGSSSEETDEESRQNFSSLIATH